MSNRAYPKGSTVTAWFLEWNRTTKPRIRRQIKTPEGVRMVETYPQKKYVNILDNKDELEDFVIRLNGLDPRVERIKNRLEFEHAYIGRDFLDEYRDVYLRSFITDERESTKLALYLERYALNYFVGRCGLANPLDWKRQEARWGLALVGKNPKGDPNVFDDGKVRSTKVLKLIVYELNRFLRFLHTKHPDIPPIMFEPFSKAIRKEHEARREMTGKIRKSKFITEAHWKVIETNLPAEWGCLVKLCYLYGLRRNEAYGLQSKDLKKGFLSIERQLNTNINDNRTFKPLKSRFARKTPHWFSSPAVTHELIQQIERLTYNSDHISHMFVELMARLELPKYTIHDLRRTFITNCVRKGIDKEELRLAVGHVDGSTTYKYYVMDARDLDGEEWVPEEIDSDNVTQFRKQK